MTHESLVDPRYAEAYTRAQEIFEKALARADAAEGVAPDVANLWIAEQSFMPPNLLSVRRLDENANNGPGYLIRHSHYLSAGDELPARDIHRTYTISAGTARLMTKVDTHKRHSTTTADNDNQGLNDTFVLQQAMSVAESFARLGQTERPRVIPRPTREGLFLWGLKVVNRTHKKIATRRGTLGSR